MNKQELAKITTEQRKRIYTRDGHCCRECGAIDNLTLDHILPKSEGGLNDDSNLQTLCATCNRRKGNNIIFKPLKKVLFILRLPDEFQKFKNLTNGLLNSKMTTVKTELNNIIQSKLDLSKNTLSNEVSKVENKLDKTANAIYEEIKVLRERVDALESKKRKKLNN